MTTPTPAQTSAQELLMRAINGAEVYEKIARESEDSGQDGADETLSVVRDVVIGFVDEFVSKFFTLKALTSAVPLSDVDMSDLRNFILFVMNDAKVLLGEEYVDGIHERYMEIASHQKKIVDRKEMTKLAAELRNPGW